uniref:UBA domain-containing protein n=1 Tax=Prymnesium polylepis TaxID=72548 RepID=A0A7S4HRG8_9EUKA
MRACALTDTAGGAEECKDNMLEYAKKVSIANHRFRGANLADARLKFEWSDSFDPEDVVGHHDWRYERVGALMNVAAAFAYLGTHEDRGTADGVKAACNNFQLAAGTIDAVREETRAAAWTLLTTDLTADFLEMLHTLFLAQAQKCFYEKAKRDGIKEKLLTMIAAECAALYKDASLKLTHLRRSLSPGFGAIIAANAALFDGLQHAHAAPGHLEALEYGKQVARLQHAAAACQQAAEVCQKGGIGGPVLKIFTDAVIKTRDDAAKAAKDNELIYTERVPVLQQLPPLERKLMVKPMTPPQLALPEMPTPLEAPTPAAAPVVVGASNIPAGPSHTVELKLYKPHATTKLGLTLTSQGTEAPAVTAVSTDGVGQALIKLGDVLLSVNGAGCNGHEHTTTMLRGEIGEISILVQRKGEKPKPAPSAAPPMPPMPPTPPAGGPPPPPSFESAQAMESEALQQLKAMGFGEAEANGALRAANHDTARAVELLAEGSLPAP